MASEELRRQMRSSSDADATWRSIVVRIDALAPTVDLRRDGLVLTWAGIVTRER